MRPTAQSRNGADPSADTVALRQEIRTGPNVPRLRPTVPPRPLPQRHTTSCLLHQRRL
ncbi:MAG: hypothetical protein IPL78_19530 [Chloroflexi bacterium]|nr:hypothetical protein [Chloroflexota bacterium]